MKVFISQIDYDLMVEFLLKSNVEEVEKVRKAFENLFNLIEVEE